MYTLQSIKQEAQDKYNTLAWPKQSDEEWRRSDPATIPFSRLEKIHPSSFSEDEKKSNLNFLNSVEESIAHKKGLKFVKWNEEQPNIVVNCLKKMIDVSKDKVDFWRATNMQVGGAIIVDAGVRVEEIINISLHGYSQESILYPQIAIIVGDRAHVSINVELSGDGFFSLGLLGYVGEMAECHINQLQNTSLDSYVINSAFSFCEQKSVFNHISGQLGSMVGIDRVYSVALGKESNIHLNGFYFGHEDQLIDVRTYQAHIAEDTNSRTLYHGLAIDESHTVYRGLIEVGARAVETDAYLTNNNLLLSEDARMDSIPCLNILTNDVRCSHGSTTGTLDEDHIFYLQSRGLSESDAKQLLIEGFFHSVFDDKFVESNKKANDIILNRIANTI